MDYFSKYKKYKIKYQHLFQQVGGDITYQYEDGWNVEFRTYTKWTDYTLEESTLINTDSNIISLPSGVTVDKNVMVQIGRVNTRKIRVKPIDDRANNLQNMIISFPAILTLPDTDRLQGELFRLFAQPSATNLFMSINPGDYPDAYAARNVKYFQKIILLGKSKKVLTLDDIQRIINQQDQEDSICELKLDRFLKKESGQ